MQGPLLKLKIDINGTAESRVFGFDFLNHIDTGDSLTGTPTIEQETETTGAPVLTIAAPQISGTQVLAQITGTGLLAYSFYGLSATVSTALGYTLVSSCCLQIIPSK